MIPLSLALLALPVFADDLSQAYRSSLEAVRLEQERRAARNQLETELLANGFKRAHVPSMVWDAMAGPEPEHFRNADTVVEAYELDLPVQGRLMVARTERGKVAIYVTEHPIIPVGNLVEYRDAVEFRSKGVLPQLKAFADDLKAQYPLLTAAPAFATTANQRELERRLAHERAAAADINTLSRDLGSLGFTTPPPFRPTGRAADLAFRSADNKIVVVISARPLESPTVRVDMDTPIAKGTLRRYDSIADFRRQTSELREIAALLETAKTLN